MNESVIDPTREDLDLKVFDVIDDQLIIKPAIKDQILRLVERIGIPVSNVYIKGSILSRQWLPQTDIDVLIETDEDMSDDYYERLKNEIKELYNGIKARGTDHPLEFYVVRGTFDASRADGLYDLINDRWIKGPYDLEVNPDEYLDKFEKTVHEVDLAKDELERDLIDYQILKSLRGEQIAHLEQRIQDKIDEINDSIETLVAQYQRLSDLRDHAFSKDLTPDEIREYGSKNALPDNVIFKLLQRYHYIKLMQELKKIIKQHGKLETDQEIQKVQQLV